MLSSKGYEREGACRLLARLGDLSNATITLDALHACHPVFDQVAKQNANMLVTVKDNASSLRAELIRQFDLAPPIDTDSTFDEGHGRREQRSIEVIPIDGKAMNWPHLRWALRVERTCPVVRGGQVVKHTSDIVYAVATHPADHPPTARQFLEWLRGHWAIENRLHHRKDRTLKDRTLMEDRSRLKNSTARIMAAARTFVTSILGALGGLHAKPPHPIRW